MAAPKLADMSYRTELVVGKMDPAHQEFEPDLRNATLGTRIHIVVNVKTQLQPDLWLVQMVLARQLDFGTWTLLNAVVSTKDPSRPHVTLDETSTPFLRRPSLTDHLLVVELCSGFGFGSQGAHAAGFHTVLKVDKQANTIDALHLQGEPALHDDSANA